MNFGDIFKSNFLENIVAVSVVDMIIAMVLSFALGVLIFYVYKRTFRGVMYSSSFGVTLIALTMIATFVILAVTSNVVLSLGMVGALSIVRFRTAIKEPLDIAFLFWAIAAGIVLAAGMIALAVFGSVLIAIVLVVFVNKKQGEVPYILVANCESQSIEKKVKEILKGKVEKSIVKSKTVSKGTIELNIEVRLKNDDTDFVNELAEIEGVQNVVLVSYNGEYMS